MGKRYFGTDGVRGVANAKLTPELAFRIGLAAGRHLGPGTHAVIGRDTRQSGSMLGAAVAAGLCSAGVDVVTLGHAPTPAVSFAARTGHYQLGIVISASHNPAPDNGIKLIGGNGAKLPDEVEEHIETLMDEAFDERPLGGQVGSIRSSREDIARYEDWLVSLVPERLDGFKVVVDGANGAAYEIGPEVLRRMGADVVALHVSPDGVNINDRCGATHPHTVQEGTRQHGAVLGVAFDGDADRAVFSDGQGRLINGDRTLAIWSAFERSQGRLSPAVVVGTVMSNGGFERYLTENAIELVRAPVGDKYVAQRMAESGARVGGEQSGHLIFAERGPTGDGLVTMLELLRVMRLSGKTAAELYDEYESWPQLLVNVSIERREGWDQGPRVSGALQEAEDALQGRGRLVVRPSGTQPMVRVMVEADAYDLRDRVAEDILAAMQAELGGSVYSRVDLTHALGD